LSADNRRAVYVPRGVAHGFQSLTDDAEVLYLISEEYDPALARGVRWDDPAFDIRWPLPPSMISARDRGYPDFSG
jgi:dTDP-4-dehydrorhamnose 3,5-epimerase